MSPTFGGYGGMESFLIALGDGLADVPEIRVEVLLKLIPGATMKPDLVRALSGSRCAARVEGAGGRLRALARADVVHLQNPMPGPTLLARLLGKPLVTSMINHRPPVASLHRFLWERARRQALVTLPISEFVRTTWEGPVPAANTRVVPPISRLGGTPLPPSERRGFCFLARWIPNKGIEDLVEAYAQSGLDPAIHPLTLLGDGPLRPEIVRRIEACGLSGRILAPGFVEEQEKMRRIAGARWMVVPPRTREDFGLTALEARWVGVPCIATRDGGVPEAAGPEALLCTPGSVAELTDLLRQAAGMSELEYSQRSRKAFEGVRCMVRPAEWYAGLYRRIVNT